MAKRHIPIIEKLGIGEVASGLTPFVETSAGDIQVKTPSGVQAIAHEGNINTILQAAGGAGWDKMQAVTANYAIVRPSTGAGLDLHIETNGSLATLNSTSWPVPANGVDQLRIRNFSGSAQTLTAGTGWTIVTADGNPVTGGSYSIPDDRAIEVTLDPDGFAQVVPWGGEVSEATFNVHTGNVSNPHVVTATQLNLGNVNNTSDVNKPVSTAQQTALNLKQDASTAATDAELTAHTGNVSNPHAVTKSQVGLGSAENTSDASKPVSTATQTALDGKSATSHAHTGTYEPSNSNIQAHVTAAHAPASAEMNVNPDWNAASGDGQILNKPTIPAAVTVNNTLTSTSTAEALSAAQGKALQDGKQELYEGTVALRTPNNLTSNTSDPNYILTASSEHTVHLFYRAFDNNDANHWYTLGTSVANGVIELNYKIRPTNLLLRGETTILEYWTRWQLQGSKDGSNWDTLVDRSGVDEVIQNTSKNFPITTSKEYKYFRFNGLAAVGTNIPLSRLEISGVEASRHTASVKVTRSTAQSLSSAGTIVSWDTVDHEVGATTLWDVANPTRLTAPVAGTYLVVADIAAESDSVGQITILKNGTTVHNGTAPRFWTGSGSTSALVRLAVGDYIECRVSPAATVNSIVAAERHYFAMVFVSL